MFIKIVFLQLANTITFSHNDEFCPLKIRLLVKREECNFTLRKKLINNK